MRKCVEFQDLILRVFFQDSPNRKSGCFRIPAPAWQPRWSAGSQCGCRGRATVGCGRQTVWRLGLTIYTSQGHKHFMHMRKSRAAIYSRTVVGMLTPRGHGKPKKTMHTVTSESAATTRKPDPPHHHNNQKKKQHC